MELLILDLKNFRNFTQKKIALDKNLTVIIGPNGSGKTNILEAALLLSGTRSHKVETDLDLVKFGKSEAKIEGIVADVNVKNKLTLNMQVFSERFVKKTYFVNSIKKRFVDFAVFFTIVVFEPQDIDLVDGSPSLRRHHIDVLLSAIDRQYWRHISFYNKIITRRNKVLSRILEGKSKKNELDFWDLRLLEHGISISKKKREFFEFLNFVERGTSPADLGELAWKLRQSEISEEKLKRDRERDIAAGVTLSGPHRDDFRFIFKNKDLAFFGSRGEQRMAVLALKLAELEYFQAQKHSRPILALDDIFSELDWAHRRAVLSTVSKQQTIITAAEIDSVPKQLLKKAKAVEL